MVEGRFNRMWKLGGSSYVPAMALSHFHSLLLAQTAPGNTATPSEGTRVPLSQDTRESDEV